MAVAVLLATVVYTNLLDGVGLYGTWQRILPLRRWGLNTAHCEM